MMKSKLIVLWLMNAVFSAGAQNNGFPPYFPTLSGLGDYIAWHVIYPDSLFRTDMPGEALCTICVDSLGKVSSSQVTASHPLFAQATKEVIDRMGNWQPARNREGRRVDSTVVIRVPFDPDAYRERVWRQQQLVEPCRGQNADTVPLFPDEVRNLVMGNMRWPDSKVQTATAVCRFIVDEEGYIGRIRVVKGTHPAFDAEAMRILSAFPRLVPAKKEGKNVPFEYFLTLNFWKADLEYYLRDREKWQKDLHIDSVELSTPAAYPGGEVAFSRFIQTHLVITPEMKATCRPGRVVYRFEVDIDGTMQNFELMRGLSALQDKEALRVLQSMHRKWNRGYCFNTEKWYREFEVNGFTVPVIFDW